MYQPNNIPAYQQNFQAMPTQQDLIQPPQQGSWLSIFTKQYLLPVWAWLLIVSVGVVLYIVLTWGDDDDNTTSATTTASATKSDQVTTKGSSGGDTTKSGKVTTKGSSNENKTTKGSSNENKTTKGSSNENKVTTRGGCVGIGCCQVTPSGNINDEMKNYIDCENDDNCPEGYKCPDALDKCVKKCADSNNKKDHTMCSNYPGYNPDSPNLCQTSKWCKPNFSGKYGQNKDCNTAYLSEGDETECNNALDNDNDGKYNIKMCEPGLKCLGWVKGKTYGKCCPPGQVLNDAGTKCKETS
jgi:hypothetical protein